MHIQRTFFRNGLGSQMVWILRCCNTLSKKVEGDILILHCHSRSYISKFDFTFRVEKSYFHPVDVLFFLLPLHHLSSLNSPQSYLEVILPKLVSDIHIFTLTQVLDYFIYYNLLVNDIRLLIQVLE